MFFASNTVWGQDSVQMGTQSHRLLAYVVSSEDEREALEATLESWEGELVDRDILLVSLGEIVLDTPYGISLSAEEKELWRTLWQLPLGESRFVLVGKDGGAKAFQRSGLDLPLFFELIDSMPMRIAEMKAKSPTANSH
ncbi:DUF4174 domain-containing protein [Pelagicoccus albus]|uniref:DUF4174 domain-containing protein n=1 Tax=Pelagicoccus albus TaxID=415222 RepID=A0A7X1E8B3_9BACT|nr:DUF4174 domain-containing protein [Pelagicoccus albus]